MITEACRAQRSRSAAITAPGVAASGCRRRRPISSALRWLVVLGLAGCGGGDPVEATATEAPAESAAAVAQGSASDGVGTTATAADVNAPASSADSSVVIRRQPLSVEALAGSVVQFGIDADGPRPITYQWLHDGHPIEGQTGPVLRVLVAPSDHLARISVIVSAGRTTTQSDSAVLRVNARVTCRLRKECSFDE